MGPKYSVLLCNKNYSDYEAKIVQWLRQGIKVFWFGSSKDCNHLKSLYSDFYESYLLQSFPAGCNDICEIIDGENSDAIIDVLELCCPDFNAAQYRVEHCKAEQHVIVQASAGTGKTTVMIDRIFFLLHTVPDLKMADLYMITFTNDATDSMNRRLQERLIQRYRLTGQQRYLRWMEEQSKMHISTIHSFAYTMLKQYGIGQGLNKDLAIRSFGYEQSQLIYDAINEYINPSKAIAEQLGVPLYKAKKLIQFYWHGFTGIGVSNRELKNMNWGETYNEESRPMHHFLTNMLSKIDDSYLSLKKESNAVGINDIMRDLDENLSREILPLPNFSMKYLFIDEFQDSDLSQISVALRFVGLMQAKLFVVGDVKQSIYRFRGANDEAFELLLHYMEEQGIVSPSMFVLVNNYRTSANVLKRMDSLFKNWGRNGLLKYQKAVIPFNKSEGIFQTISARSIEEVDDKVVHLSRNALNKIVKEIESKKGNDFSEKDRVVLLTRSNKQLDNLSQILRNNRIPASIKKDGSFFISEAVRDFYAMICSYMFPHEPLHMFNYLMTPYADNIEPLDINKLEKMDADRMMVERYMKDQMNRTVWEKYRKQFRLRPIMAVIKDIIDNEPIMETYIQNAKRIRTDKGWSTERNNADTSVHALQYQANLDKLLEILQRNFEGKTIGLKDIYSYLKYAIATDRSEQEPDVESHNDYRSVLCMTVHKAKGLEYHTVIIPYTMQPMVMDSNIDIFIDPVKKDVGWYYSGQNRWPQMCNDLYPGMKEDDIRRTIEEETRILYVAMTRSIKNLYCIVAEQPRPQTWSFLITEAEG